MAERYLNTKGFSGGEKRNEILQLFLISWNQLFALLDELTQVDIDALKVVSKGVNAMRGKRALLMIIATPTNVYVNITPDVVHDMMMERSYCPFWWSKLAAFRTMKDTLKLAEERLWLRKNWQIPSSFRRSKWLKSRKLFQKCTLNDWLALTSSKKLLIRLSLELQLSGIMKFHRWNLGDNLITESEPSAENVPRLQL